MSGLVEELFSEFVRNQGVEIEGDQPQLETTKSEIQEEDPNCDFKQLDLVPDPKNSPDTASVDLETPPITKKNTAIVEPEAESPPPEDDFYASGFMTF